MKRVGLTCSWWSLSIAVAILLGLGLRGYQYLHNPPIWHDEGALVINVVANDYHEMFGSLILHEAAPPLFLVAEKVVTEFLGESPYALRLLPFLASCVALILFLPIARSLLPHHVVPWAIVLFAGSPMLVEHSFEAKPYAVDVLIAVTALFVYSRHHQINLAMLLASAAIVAPVLIWISFPACFVIGGLLVALLPAVVRDGRPSVWISYSLFAVATAVAFLALVVGPIHAQKDTVLLGDWFKTMPNWESPLTVPLWTFMQTLSVSRYCMKPLGQLFVPLALVGIIAFWRKGERQHLVAVLLPVLLALLASYMHKYPYCGKRVMLYATPALVLLVVAGLASIQTWSRPRLRLVGVCLGLALLLPFAESFRQALHPRLQPEYPEAADFVLARRSERNLICANGWPHRYYFRACRDFRFLGQDMEPYGDRYWFVFSASVPCDKRYALALRTLPIPWRAKERHDFRGVTVLLLERPERSNLASGTLANAESTARID